MKTQTIISELLQTQPYALGQNKKQALLVQCLRDLSVHHYRKSRIYRNIIDRIFGGPDACRFDKVEEVPFLPVSLFKNHKLCSVPPDEVFKVLTSSGTMGQRVSKVYLDRETAGLQAKVLVKIAQHFLGKDRLPMVILDHESVIRDRRSYSARGAGISGMIQFGRRPFYALKEDMSLDIDGLKNYIEKAGVKKILFFGFTFMVWQYFLLALENQGITLDLKEAVLVHSGGWKKLEDQAVSQETFRNRIKALGIRLIINFYGMVEQVGSVYFENPIHYLHAPVYSDIIIRDPVSLKILPPNETGVIQTVSMLPVSYPGHSILTEDLGVIRGVDNCELNMNGRYFEILGRVPNAELRGCSDTFHQAVEV